MNNYNLFSGAGKFYKGCLHCHSNNSDGMLTKEEIVSKYSELGYDFLAITDHQYFTDYELEKEGNLLMIPGIEYGLGAAEYTKAYHFVGLRPWEDKKNENMYNGEKLARPTDKDSPQSMINLLRERNNSVILCHPVWSRLVPEDFKDLDGYFAFEVYNHLSEKKWHQGLSDIYWESLLMSGKKIWGVATDDAHHKHCNIKEQGGGWVMVKADALTGRDIMKSLLSGKFYSSSGPTISVFEVINGTVYVECSPVKEIHFMTNTRGISVPGGIQVPVPCNNAITSAEHKLKGDENYIRVECVDSSGRTAWSNPIFFD